MLKKILSIVTVMSFTLSLLVPVYADNKDVNYYLMSNQDLVKISSLSLEDISRAKKMNGEESFNKNFDYYIQNTKKVNSSKRNDKHIELADSETGKVIKLEPDSRISNSSWEFMSEKFKAGQILITDDASTCGYDHGHAAILISETKTVEHLGSGTTELSGEYNVDWWQGYDTIKSFNYSSSSTMSKAARYAKNNLKDWQYNVLADRTSAYGLNCATLVWKAYNSQNNINIVNTNSGTVIPKDFDKSTKIFWVRSVGWNTVNW